MEKPKTTMSQVKSGFRLAGLTLVGFVVAAMFFGGVLRLWGEVERSSWSSRYTTVMGFVFLIVSIPIMFVTMNRWLKVMAGFLGLAVVNGLISLGTGHVLANPTMPIPRPYALSLTFFSAAAAVLTGKLKNRQLSVVERILVMAFLFSLGILISYQGQRELSRSAPFNSAYFILMGIGLGCLFVAWAYDRLKGRPGRNLPDHHVGSAAGSPVDPS